MDAHGKYFDSSCWQLVPGYRVLAQGRDLQLVPHSDFGGGFLCIAHNYTSQQQAQSLKA